MQNHAQFGKQNLGSGKPRCLRSCATEPQTTAHYGKNPAPSWVRHSKLITQISLRRVALSSDCDLSNQDQRDRVKALLEAGRDEETIEKETQVSDRTIRRWKMELERTGRIGKPPESRTGRHRVLNPEVETVGSSQRLVCAVN